MTLQPLPLDWTKAIFKRLRGVYGQALMANTWGDDLAETFEVWAEELAGFREHPEAIKYALHNLPRDFPPNLLQFKDLCRDGMRHQQSSQQTLVYKLTDEEKAQNLRNMEKIKELIGLKEMQNER